MDTKNNTLEQLKEFIWNHNNDLKDCRYYEADKYKPFMDSNLLAVGYNFSKLNYSEVELCL